MQLEVNGEQRDFADASTLADVMVELDAPAKGIAVALDGAVVRRADWSATSVSDGARVEILTAVQGG